MAALYGYTAIVKALLNGGADVNARDRCGNTPLHQAAERGQKSVVVLLLFHVAADDVTNTNGQTPQALAALNGYQSINILLLNHKCAAANLKNYLAAYLEACLAACLKEMPGSMPVKFLKAYSPPTSYPIEIVGKIVTYLSLYDLRKFLEIPDEEDQNSISSLTGDLKSLLEAHNKASGVTLSGEDEAMQIFIQTILGRKINR